MRRYRSDREPEEDGPMNQDDDRLGKGRVAVTAEQQARQTPTAVATGVAVRTVIALPPAPAPVRRYRSYNGETEGGGQASRDEDRLGKGMVVAAAEQPFRQSPIAVGVSAGLALVAATTVAAKLHKYGVEGGGRFSSGAAAVIVEDVALFLALFGLWRAVRWGADRLLAGGGGRERARRAPPLALAVLLWGSVVSVTLLTLAYVAIEHLYFLSTSSLLDSDAIIVAKKSLGPIIFIALQVEGERGKHMALAGVGALIALGAAAYKLRRWAASNPDTVVCRRARKALSRSWRASRAMAGHYLPTRGVPAAAAAAASRLCTPLGGLPKAPAAVLAFSGLVFLSAALGPGLAASKSDHSRVRLLRRNCFVGITLGLRSTPSSDGSDHWVAAVSGALSAKVEGGLDINVARASARMHHAELLDVVEAADKRKHEHEHGHGVGKAGEEKKPNIVVVVLESTTGTLVTASNAAGVSPWAKELAARGMTSSRFYSSMPNTNKAMFQVMCGMTPSLETAWVEFDRPDVVEGACLPGLLRSKLGYQSLMLTGSMVGGLGVFAHDDVVGFAGEEEQGGGAGFKAREVHEKFAFEHGTFEKVNYLGYDDHVVLNRSISFLTGEDGSDAEAGQEGGGKLLTILTVGPHHFHDVPSDFVPQDFGPWEEEADTESLHYKYLVALRYQDLFLERLYQQLDKTGLSENTYVVIVGDHGEAFNEHGFDKHGNNVYQEGILVPFSLTGPPDDPRITAGATFDRAGMHADIMPTLLDLVGLWKHPRVPPPPTALPGGRKSADALFEELKVKQQQQQQREAALPGGGVDVSSARLRGVREGGEGGEGGGAGENGSGSPNSERSIPLVGSGLVGDSLFGPDYRGCAVGATHYGAKTLAVAAGDWKGLFMYSWKKEGEYTHAEVEDALLFDLSTDPREQQNLVRDVGTGSCCRREGRAGLSGPELWEGEVSASCFAAAQYPSSLLRRKDFWEGGESLAERARFLALEVCCHLEAAAVSFARDNLAFFGRQGFEQVGEDTKPNVKKPEDKKAKKKKKANKKQNKKPKNKEKPKDSKPTDK